MTSAIKKDNRVHIIQGEYFVTGDSDVMVTTILGSCVAACIRDPFAGVGGINHFLLPGTNARTKAGEAERLGVHLMELLVNGLLKAGARRDRLEAKIFGGARTVRSHNDIGKHNAEFAERFLRDEGIAHVGGSTGGLQGRRIQYWPVSGRARQNLLAGTVEIVPPAAAARVVASNAGELELF
ncbi:MAG: chemotaxis protein CheD [Hyphomicrobium sp.]|uniref:chemotaxis protein CheD n=1 Tax=Hyphomicrobium sp. TaxID=82 RepID=UPI003564613B